MPTFPPRLTSILTEANAIAPHRRTSSDGMLGDAAHRAEVSDHNPDANGVVHAVDISESKPGTPYWQPGYDVFDVHQKQRDIASAYVAATAVERARRWPWLTPGGGYMVGFDGSRDVIFNPSVSLTWRDNGGTSHNQHGHFSIGHNATSENDRQPIFGGTQPQGDEVTDADMQRLVKELGPVIVEACNKAIKHEFGGYKNGKFIDGLMLERLRAQLGASQ